MNVIFVRLTAVGVSGIMVCEAGEGRREGRGGEGRRPREGRRKGRYILLVHV